jgi:hypothetical protein
MPRFRLADIRGEDWGRRGPRDSSLLGKLESELKLEELSDESDGGGPCPVLFPPRKALSRKLPAANLSGITPRTLGVVED